MQICTCVLKREATKGRPSLKYTPRSVKQVSSVKCQVSSVKLRSCFNIILPLSDADARAGVFGTCATTTFGSSLLRLQSAMTDTSATPRELAMLRAEQTLLLQTLLLTLVLETLVETLL